MNAVMKHLKVQEQTRESSTPSSMEKGSQNSHNLEPGPLPDEHSNVVRISSDTSTRYPRLTFTNKLIEIGHLVRS